MLKSLKRGCTVRIVCCVLAMLLFATYVSSVTYNTGDIIWSVFIDFDYSSWNLDDSAHAVTVDSTGVYIAGRNLYGLYGYNQWVVEKRTLDGKGGTDGKGLLWRNFVINSKAWPNDVAVDSTGVYVVGYKNDGNMWYVEKRELSTGNLLWSKDLNFYSDAPPTIPEQATGVALDSTGVYIVGYTGKEWRVEKRTLNGKDGVDGNGLLWSKLFTTDIGNSPIPYTVVVDLTGVYIAGKESVTESIGVIYDWRIEKRALDTGDLIWERRSVPSPSGSSAFDLAVDSSGIYISGDGGYAGTGSSYSTWRVEKRTLDGKGGTDGKGLLWSKQEGLSDKSDQPLGLAVDSSGVYVVGEQSFVITNGLPNPSLGNGLWRVEKRNLETGEVEWFKADDLSPGTVKDTPNDVAVDSSGIYVVGRQSGKDIWRVEKRVKTRQSCDATTAEICNDNIDNNCDGATDCYDNSCNGKVASNGVCCITNTDCLSKPSVDSDGGVDPLVGGTVTDYLSCSSRVCSVASFPDLCYSQTGLTEYYLSSFTLYSSGSTGKSCSSYDVSACLGSLYMKKTFGCGGTPAYCADSFLPDVHVGVDVDKDGVDKECGDPNDNDPNVPSITGEICTIAGDEDNNNKCDYDDSICLHGDAACPVGVLAGSLVVADSNPIVGSAVQVSCGSTISGVQSISVMIMEELEICEFDSQQRWDGNVAKFLCKPSLPAGQKTVRCFVDTDKSYVDTINGVGKQESVINVLSSDCDQYTSSSACSANNKCEWCPLCDGVKSSGRSKDKCVNKGLCPKSGYSCHKNEACGAVCDITLGGCANPNPFCNYDTCACSATNPYGEVCDDGLDNDNDLSIDCRDSDCFGSDACACGSGELLCGDNTCKDSCGNDPAPCNNNKNCEFGESCDCADCNNVKDTCKSGNVCDADTKVCGCSTGLLPCTDGSCSSSCGVCGNGIVDQNSGELCDGSDLSGLDPSTGCSDLGFDGGVLACVSGVNGCHFDTSQCVGSTGDCGNGVRDVGEECDTSDLGSLNSLTGCSDLGFSNGILACISGVNGCLFDTAACFDVASCSTDKDCPSGGICDLSLGRCACPPSTSLCADGSCSSNCVGSKGCVNQNGLCDVDEGCGCADCEVKRASCSSDSVCVAGVCEVCSLDRAYWEGIGANCKEGVCVVAEGQEVSLVAKGAKGCSGKVFDFNVISEDTFLGMDSDKVVAGPVYGVFSNDASSVGWGVVFVGSGLYYFSAETQGVQSKLLSGSKIKVCASDADCDGVLDGVDQCPDTPYGEVVSDEGSNRGCSSSQWACVSQIDCSGVKWGECDDSTNKQVRVICKDKNTGLPDPRADPKTCCDDPDTCLCSLSGCTGKSSWIATKKDCMVEEEFPFFTAGNIVAVLIILVMFYYFYNRKTSKKRTR